MTVVDRYIPRAPAAPDRLRVAACLGGPDHADVTGGSAGHLPAIAVDSVGVDSWARCVPVDESVEPGKAQVRVVESAAPTPGGRGYAHTVLDALRYAMALAGGSLTGRRVVVTAGGTREPLDPVRSITNRSSGRMGHAIAEAARDGGAFVTLLTSAADLPVPAGVHTMSFSDVESLRTAVLTATRTADTLVMAAAVSDFRPRVLSEGKIKKSAEGMTLDLAIVPNFIPDVPEHVFLVGFAAETDTSLTKAAGKRVSRGFDLLCLNDVSRSDTGFEVDTNMLTILDADGVRLTTPLLSKYEIGRIVVDQMAHLPNHRSPSATTRS